MKSRHSIRIAFVKFGGLSAGGTERWLQTMAANLPRDEFRVDYYYCDSAPYIGSSVRHAGTNPDRLRYMQDRGVNVIRFNVGAKDIRKRTHDWIDTNFWDLFESSRYAFVQTGKAGPAEYPYYLLDLPVIEYVALDAGVDFSANIAASIHPSSWQRAQWVKRGGSIEKSSVIPVPVGHPATSEDLRKDLDIPPDAVVAGFHQRDDDAIMSPIPLEAFASLESTHRYFILMGGGIRYKQQAEKLGLKNIRFVGHSADPLRISRFLNTLDIYAHGRKDGETFGTVLAEALIHGKPCLSHRSYRGANAQPETMGPAGLFAENSHDYADKLRQLFENKSFRQDLAAKARPFAELKYSESRCAEALGRIYREVCKRGTYSAPKAEQESVAAEIPLRWEATWLKARYWLRQTRETGSAQFQALIWSQGLTNSSQWLGWINRLTRKKDEIAWVILGQSLASVGGFVGVKFLTKTLGPAGYGELALGLSVSGFLFSFMYAPMATAIGRYYSIYREKKDLDTYFSAVRSSQLLFGAISLLVALLAAFFLRKGPAFEWAWIVVSGIMLGIANGVFNTFLMVFSVTRQRKRVALQQGAEPCLRVLMALLLIHWLGRSGICALCGFFVGLGVVVAAQLCILYKDRDAGALFSLRAPDKIAGMSRIYRDLYRYAASIFVISVLSSLPTSGDRWIVQGWLGLKEVGIYAALFQIANAPINIISGVMAQLIIPVIYERAGTMSNQSQFDRSRNVFRLAVSVNAVMYSGVVVVAFYMNRVIVRLLTTPEFAVSAQYLWVLVLGLSIYQLGNVISTKGMYFNKPHIYIIPRACMAIVFMGCAVLSVPRFHLLGIVWTWVVAALAYALATFAANENYLID